MEREIDKNTIVLRDEKNFGSVQIADDVVSMIAALAATEVEGVHSMAGNSTHEVISRIGVKSLAKGIRVEVTGQKVKIDLAINLDYGYSIPVASQQVQAKVKNAVETMTGLKCTDVNIRISGIIMKKG